MGQLVVLQGDTGVGKSTFASQIIAKVLQNTDKNILIYSGEQGKSQIQETLYKQLSTKDNFTEFDEYGNVSVKAECCDELSKTYGERVFVWNNDYTGDTKPFTEIINNEITEHNVEFILVDNLMTVMDNADSLESSLIDRQSHFVEELNQIAMANNIIIMLVCHQKKREYGQIISNVHTVYDILGTSGIPNKAHTIIYYERSKDKDTRKNGGLLKVLKNRHGNGQLDDINFEFAEASLQFREVTK